MSQQVIGPEVALRLNEDRCSDCSICFALCPFEALKKDPESGKISLEIEKCQVCGLCYSTCPARAIDILYYNLDSLTNYIQRAKKKYDSDTLLIACKGSSPDLSEARALFGLSKFIPLSVPCVGRVPEDVYLKSLAELGIQRICVLACDEDYCRFERGSAVSGRRILALNLLLEQFGFGPEVIILKKSSLKVKATADRCIRCGNCVFYCPYEAVKLEATQPASFNLELCHGCGLCVAICPAKALELENWERERISKLIAELASEVQKPKVLVFRCQWAAFPQLDDGIESDVGLIDLPCAGRIDTYHILEAFERGIDGVMVVACPEEDCKMKKGSKEARHWVNNLKQQLAQIGLGDNLHFCFVFPRHPENFTEEVKQFKAKLQNKPLGG